MTAPRARAAWTGGLGFALGAAVTIAALGCTRPAEPVREGARDAATTAADATSPAPADAAVTVAVATAPRVADAAAQDAADAATSVPAVRLDALWSLPRTWGPDRLPTPTRRCFVAPAIAAHAERAEGCVVVTTDDVATTTDRWARLFPGAPPTPRVEHIGRREVTTAEARGDRAFLWDGEVPVFPTHDWSLRAAVVDIGPCRLVFELTGTAASVRAAAADFDAAWRRARFDAALDARSPDAG